MPKNLPSAIVIFAVNLFFSQRLIRAMHPLIGWHPIFSYFSLFMILSVPAIIVTNIVSLTVSFFSVGKPEQLAATLTALKFGVSWATMLAGMPLIWIFLASAMPGPTPENFGTGDFRAKAALLVFSAATLMVGAVVRLATSVNPEGPEVKSRLFSKSVFYITGFLLEILTVAAYAVFRIDLIFHIPNGAKGPGDYSGNSRMEGRFWAPHELENEIRKIGVRHEILYSRGRNKHGPVMAILYPDSNQSRDSRVSRVSKMNSADSEDCEKQLPPLPTDKMNRRRSQVAISLPKRETRANAMSMYKTDDLPVKWAQSSASYL